MCQTVQDGVQIMKLHGITEWLLLHVQYLNSKCSPSSNTIKLNFMDSYSRCERAYEYKQTTIMLNLFGIMFLLNSYTVLNFILTGSTVNTHE